MFEMSSPNEACQYQELSCIIEVPSARVLSKVEMIYYINRPV